MLVHVALQEGPKVLMASVIAYSIFLMLEMFGYNSLSLMSNNFTDVHVHTQYKTHSSTWVTGGG